MTTEISSRMPSKGDNEQTASVTPSGPFSFPGTPKVGKFGGAEPPTKFAYQDVPGNWFPKQGDLQSNGLVVSNGGPMSKTNFNVGEPQTESIGFPSNYRVTYAKMAKPIFNQPGDMSITQKHQLMFTMKQSRELIKDSSYARNPQRRYHMVNLPQLNYFLAKKRIDELAKGTIANKWMGIEDILDKWTLEGVVATEEGQEYANAYPDEFGRERVFNVAIRGRCTTHNIWANNPRPGQRLYLLVKRVSHRVSKYVVHPTAPHVNKELSIGQVSDSVGPFQVIPWTSREHEYPTDKDLDYQDKVGDTADGITVTRRAAVIYIGKIESNVERIAVRYYEDAKNANVALYTDINQIAMRPTMLIHLDSTL